MRADFSEKKYQSWRTFSRTEFANSLQLLDWVESQGLGCGNAMRIDLLSKSKGIGIAEDYFYNIPDSEKDHRTYGALLSCYCSEKAKDKAISIFKTMKELGLSLTSIAFNNIMSLHLKLNQPEEVGRLFSEMKASKTIPDKCSYKILIESYSLLNDIGSIDSTVQKMEVKEGAWHWSLYCHLAGIYNSAKLFESARISLKKAELMMRGHDLAPFPYLISLYAGCGDLQEVKRVWGLLKGRVQRYRFPTNKEYLVMLQAIKKLDDIDALRALFEEWGSVCVSYDMKLANVMIEAYLEKHMVEEARKILENGIMVKRTGLALKSFWLFIDYYWKNGEIDQARRWSVRASGLVKRRHSGEPDLE